MHAAANGRHNGAAPRQARPEEGKGIRKKRRHMRAILKEGLEAALRADPDVLETCKPKTAYGRIICGLVLEAAKCKATPLKTLMSLIDWQPHEDDEDFVETDDETPWDWSPDGTWLTMPEPEAAPAVAEKTDGAARAELVRRLTRLEEAGQHEQVARIVEAIRAASHAPEPLPSG